jgi:hypothetical protein
MLLKVGRLFLIIIYFLKRNEIKELADLVLSDIYW